MTYILKSDLPSDNNIQHYGVPGMKWGRRKASGGDNGQAKAMKLAKGYDQKSKTRHNKVLANKKKTSAAKKKAGKEFDRTLTAFLSSNDNFSGWGTGLNNKGKPVSREVQRLADAFNAADAKYASASRADRNASIAVGVSHVRRVMGG